MSDTFKTPIPVDRLKSIFKGDPIAEHPYRDDEVCGKCRMNVVCKRARDNLPLVFLEISQPVRKHRCPKVGEMQICVVLHGEGYEGKQVEPLNHNGKPHKKRPKKERKKRRVPEGIYLVDANVFINAMNPESPAYSDSRWLIFNSGVSIGTTERVLKEVHDMDEPMRKRIKKVYSIDSINVDICALRTYYRAKEPSVRDLTLIQAAVDNREVRGIITYDQDFANIAAGGMVKKLSGRKIDVFDAAGLKKKIVKPEDR